MKFPFDYWIESEEGQTANLTKDADKQPYLKNRLYRTFNAGLRQSGVNQHIEELRRKNSELMVDLYNAKRMIKQLTKIKKLKEK